MKVTSRKKRIYFFIKLSHFFGIVPSRQDWVCYIFWIFILTVFDSFFAKSGKYVVVWQPKLMTFWWPEDSGKMITNYPEQKPDMISRNSVKLINLNWKRLSERSNNFPFVRQKKWSDNHTPLFIFYITFVLFWRGRYEMIAFLRFRTV